MLSVIIRREVITLTSIYQKSKTVVIGRKLILTKKRFSDFHDKEREKDREKIEKDRHIER
jgi:hypothetical protein